MKASRFTEAEKAFALKQGEEGAPVAEICRSSSVWKSIQWIDFSAERNQPGDLCQPKEAIRRVAARRDAPAEGA